MGFNMVEENLNLHILYQIGFLIDGCCGISPYVVGPGVEIHLGCLSQFSIWICVMFVTTEDPFSEESL